jgi:hypothetical protein
MPESFYDIQDPGSWFQTYVVSHASNYEIGVVFIAFLVGNLMNRIFNRYQTVSVAKVEEINKLF